MNGLHNNDKHKEIADRKGDVRQDGDEVCFVKLKTVGFFKKSAIMIPDGKGGFTTHEMPYEEEED